MVRFRLVTWRSFASLSMFSAIGTAAVACSSPASETKLEVTGIASDKLVDTDRPLLMSASVSDLGLLPVHGRFPQVDSHGATLAYQGQYSRGDDLSAPPDTSRDPWVLASVTPGLVPITTLPALTSALDAADADNRGLDAGAVASLFDLLSFLGLSPPAPSTPFASFQGYTPIRARWRSAQFEGGSIFRGIPIAGVMQKNPAPVGAEEFRDRGARLYCAARKLTFEARSESRSMGEQVAFSVKILGQKIDFLVVEPMVAMGGPKVFGPDGFGRFTFPSGSQAFEVPMGFGTRITPIRGIGLPGLREIRYPVELISADTEVLTPADLGRRNDGSIGFKKQYTTAEHVDALQSAWEEMSTSISVPLFEAGVLRVTLTVTLSADIGRPLRPGGSLPIGLSAQPYDRVIDTTSIPFITYPPTRPIWSPFADPTRTVTYHDGAWAANQCVPTELRPCPTWNWAVRPSETSPTWQTSSGALGGFLTRVQQDDDHVSRTRTALGLKGEVTGAIGFDHVGPFRVSLTLKGGLDGSVGQSHMLRDAMIAELPDGDLAMRAASAVTVRPRTDAVASLTETNATLHFSIHIPFYGEVSWDPNLLHADPISLASWDTDDAHKAWKEESSLRIGTGANSGNVTKQPNVFSHLPKGPDASTFVQDVDTCLADARPNPPPAPLCKSEPPTGKPPRANMCLFKIGQFPPNVCTDIPGAVANAGVTAEQTTCLTDYYAFLCKPVSHQVPGALSHIVDIGSEQTMTEVGNIMSECVTAFVPLSSPDLPMASKTFSDAFFRMAFCDDAAVLLSSGEAFGPWSSTPSEPPDVTPPSTPCE